MSTRYNNAYWTQRSLTSLHLQLKKLQVSEAAAFASHIDQSMRLCRTPADRMEECFVEAKQILSGLNGSPVWSAVIYPFPRQHLHWREGAVVLQLFGVTRDGQKKFVRRTQIKDYHWQNQTDQPDNVTDGDWAARKRAWDLMCPSGFPAQDGFVFEGLTAKLALEILFARTRLAVPPPVELQRMEGGKPWTEWGPEWDKVFCASDAERYWNKDYCRGLKKYEIELTRRWLRIENDSRDSSML